MGRTCQKKPNTTVSCDTHHMTLFARDQPYPGHQSQMSLTPSMPVPTPDATDVQTPANSETPTPAGGTEVLSPAQEPKVTESWPSQELTSSQTADVRNASQSARFLALPKDEQVALLRAHKNLGHPSPERLSTLLRAQGYRAEIAQAALELKCSTCQETNNPNWPDRAVSKMTWTSMTGYV